MSSQAEDVASTVASPSLTAYPRVAGARGTTAIKAKTWASADQIPPRNISVRSEVGHYRRVPP